MIAVIIGTRPELIKMAPVLRRLKEKGIPYVFIHSNQHYSKELDEKIISDLGLGKQDYNLNVGSASHAVQTGMVMERAEKIFIEICPEAVLVHGDTNTALAGALAAKKLNIPVWHVEAGLRSFDCSMPEEINRMLIDRISDKLFVPTEIARKNLKSEGVCEERILVTGNTIVDALNEHLKLSEESKIFEDLKIDRDNYILVTAHRPENVDEKSRLEKLFAVIQHASKKIEKSILFPVHFRTRKNIEEHDISVPNNIVLIDPVGYIDMLALIANASLVMTDSGGIQEEAYILKKRLVTLRDSTERPETLTANFIVDNNIEKFDSAWEAFERGNVMWENSFGSGDASTIIINSIEEHRGI